MRRIRKHGKTIEKKTDRILAGGRIPDGEIRVCDVEKYYGSDTNITKAVDRCLSYNRTKLDETQ